MPRSMDVVDRQVHICNNTTTEEMDAYFDRLWRSVNNAKIHLIIDTTNCDNMTLSKALTMKRVVERHRDHSRRHIDRSTIYVNSRFMRGLIRTALVFMRAERPVHVVKK